MIVKAIGVACLILGALVITIAVWASLSEDQLAMIEDGSEA